MITSDGQKRRGNQAQLDPASSIMRYLAHLIALHELEGGGSRRTTTEPLLLPKKEID